MEFVSPLKSVRLAFNFTLKPNDRVRYRLFLCVTYFLFPSTRWFLMVVIDREERAEEEIEDEKKTLVMSNDY